MLSLGRSSLARTTVVGRRRLFDVGGLRLVKTFDKAVDPFSKIRLETPMSVKITPADADDGLLLVSLYSGSDCADSRSDFSIKQTAERVDVVGERSPPDAEAVCVVRAPVGASFEVEAKGKSDVVVERMRSDECHLRAESGRILLTDLKANSVRVRSKEGSVSCRGTIQAGNLDIKTDGDVACDHVRSNSLKIVTDSGDISAESCYSTESHFTTAVGSLRLGCLHGRCTVEVLERGDLTLTGFEGTVEAILKRGNVHLQAFRLYDKNSVFVHEAGTVDVRLSGDVSDLSLIELIARKLDVEEEILKRGALVDDSQHRKFRYESDQPADRRHDLYVECRNGTVDLKLSSFIAMMKRKKENTDEDVL